MRRIYLLLLAFFPLYLWAGGEDDFATWLELGAEKILPYNFTVGAEGELRTQDNSSKIKRFSIGVNGGYKVNKYLKLGVTYNFLEGYSPDKEGKSYYTPGYWTPRHRASFDVCGDIKLWGLVKFSVRERYQYTFRKEQEIDRYSQTYNGDGELVGHDDESEPKIKSRADVHLLRSRLKIEFSRKHWQWTPFVSVEAQNNLRESMHLHKVRSMAGTEYEITKQHKISAAYVFTCETKESPRERIHAISIGYNYKF